jgi:helicase
MAFRGLFIGIDRNASPGVSWLSCAGRDAKALYALFTDSFGGETTLLLDDQAMVAEIGRRFDALCLRPRGCCRHRLFRPRHEHARTGHARH